MNPRVQLHKQQLRREQVELESALEQLEKNPVSYSLVGSVMVREEASSIRKRLLKRLSVVQQEMSSLDDEARRDS
ncbi:MAG: hypothetical protein ACMXYD_01785 [Candidatus Woesearchaeota archaeon]